MSSEDQEVLVASIDEGTSSTRFMVFSSKSHLPVTSHQINVNSKHFENGCEQDPLEIFEKVMETIAKTCEKLKTLNISPITISAVGITNQRETTVVWDKITGKPLYNALVWMDLRTQYIVDKFQNKKIPECNSFEEMKRHLQLKTGLILNPYFSVFKLIWLIENVPAVQKAVKENNCMFGTIDSWLIWNLTGGINGGIHITDVTNASRTMLMNINSLQWDESLFNFFEIPKGVLFPEIRSCSEEYGRISMGPLLGTVISGCVGDQQSALLGQMCFLAGQTKCTFGTGCFLLYNTGLKPVISNHGLLTTIAFKMGRNADPIYALEGSLSSAGSAVNWLKTNLNIDTKDDSLEECDNVYFVPAFSGLYAPYWKSNARGTISGLTMNTRDTHLIRATLEGICFQAIDVIHAMESDTGSSIVSLNVDGGMVTNDKFVQILSNLSSLSVVRPKMCETTSLGAALAAGIGAGVWNMYSIKSESDTFVPNLNKDEQKKQSEFWKIAIEQSIGWDKNIEIDTTDIVSF